MCALCAGECYVVSTGGGDACKMCVMAAEVAWRCHMALEYGGPAGAGEPHAPGLNSDAEARAMSETQDIAPRDAAQRGDAA